MARHIDPNRGEVIARILSQAAVVFAEQGYRNSTTEDIADKVKLKKSSLYHYFKNKENILFQALSLNLKRSLEPLLELQNEAGPPRDRLRKAIVVQVRMMIDAPYIANLFLNERSSLHPAHLKQCLELRRRHEIVLRSILEEGIADGSFDVIDSNVAVKLIFGALNGLPWWWRPSGKYSIEETADIFADLLVDRMLRAPAKPPLRMRTSSKTENFEPQQAATAQRAVDRRQLKSVPQTSRRNLPKRNV